MAHVPGKTRKPDDRVTKAAAKLDAAQKDAHKTLQQLKQAQQTLEAARSASTDAEVAFKLGEGAKSEVDRASAAVAKAKSTVDNLEQTVLVEGRAVQELQKRHQDAVGAARAEELAELESEALDALRDYSDGMAKVYKASRLIEDNNTLSKGQSALLRNLAGQKPTMPAVAIWQYFDWLRAHGGDERLTVPPPIPKPSSTVHEF